MSRPRRTVRQLPSSPFVREPVTPPSTADYHVGDRVTWDKKGMGRVVAVTDEHITVDFGAGGTLSLPAGTAGLSRL